MIFFPSQCRISLSGTLLPNFPEAATALDCHLPLGSGSRQGEVIEIHVFIIDSLERLQSGCKETNSSPVTDLGSVCHLDRAWRVEDIIRNLEVGVLLPGLLTGALECLILLLPWVFSDLLLLLLLVQTRGDGLGWLAGFPLPLTAGLGPVESFILQTSFKMV